MTRRALIAYADTAYPGGCAILTPDMASTRDKHYREFLALLRQARLNAGLSQEAAANLLGRPQSYVSRSESGERRVDVIELTDFARIYNLSIADLVPEQARGKDAADE